MSTAAALAPLLARTREIEAPAVGLLDLVPESGALAWVRDGEGVVGWGEVARLALPPGPASAEGFAQAQSWWRAFGGESEDEVGLPGTGLLAFGSFAFDPARSQAGSALVVPRVVVGHRDGSWWRTTICRADEPPAWEASLRAAPRPPAGLAWSPGARTDEQWQQAVTAAVERIRTGGLDKVVLARDIVADLDAPLDARWPLARLATSYPACWTFAVDGLLGATPEMLVRLRDGVASSRVLAGTLRRSGDAAQDERRGTALAGSVKDLEEHGYGVRSVADALAPHCADGVEVPAAPFVLELPNVMHLATDLTGLVTDGATSLGLLASLHPSAAVCGTPRAAALEVIREVEGLDRGRYAGPVGWVDASGDGEWGIALRCAEVGGGGRRLRLFAGCGIVDGSRAADELAESEAKLVPMRSALRS